MYIDIFIIVLISLMLIRGIVKGGFGYIYLIMAMIAAMFITHFTSPQLASYINENLGISFNTAYTVSSITICSSATIILRICIGWLLAPILNHFLSTTNKLLGAFTGTVNGVVISYLILWLLVTLSTTFPNWNLIKKIQPSDSITYNLVRKNNYLSSLDITLLPKLQQFLESAQQGAFNVDDATTESSQTLKDLINDHNFMDNLKKRNYSDIIINPKVRKILQDKNFQEQMSKMSGQQNSAIQGE